MRFDQVGRVFDSVRLVSRHYDGVRCPEYVSIRSPLGSTSMTRSCDRGLQTVA